VNYFSGCEFIIECLLLLLCAEFAHFLLSADNGTMSYAYKTMTNVSPDETAVTKLSEEDESKLPIILGAVFGVLLIVVVIGALLFRRHLAQQAKVSHQDVKGSQNTNTTCAQNTSYQGSAMGRPGTPGKAAPVEARHSAGKVINFSISGIF
jgi:hypothetical protein